MKELLLRNLSTILTLLAVAVLLAFLCSALIKISLLGTGIKTDFPLVFLMLFSILSAISLIIFTVQNFIVFKEIIDLRKKWKIPAKDIIEGIYTYEIDYYCKGAEKFLELLQEAKRKSHESHA